MISLEQIRLLEGKITRAIELIRVLKEENATLRKGLDSAQKRMMELENLVDGFKSDQKEIESVIVRTLKNLDDIEETIHTQGAGRVEAGAARAEAGSAAAEPARAQARKADRAQTHAVSHPADRPAPPSERPPESAAARPQAQPPQPAEEPGDSSKGELDIF